VTAVYCFVLKYTASYNYFEKNMAKHLDKEYKCPYCFQTSSRKYNINIHIQRKHHHPYPQINNTNQSPTFNEPPNFIVFEKSSPSNWDRSMERPTSSPFFIPPTFTFHPNYLFNDKVKDDENERESRRRFNKTLWEYMQKIVIPSLNFQNTQFNYSESIRNIPIFIDPKNMPKAHKIYKCQKCFMPTLKPFFDFQEIHPANKFFHSCYSTQQQQKHTDNNDPQIKTLNLQEILLSVIDSRLKSENKLLKMIVFPQDLIENSLSLKLLIFLMDIVGNEDYYPLRWLFELLKNERFVDLGKISSQHWVKRAFDHGNYSAEENVTKLEKEELKQFISRTEGTFGLIKFKIDNNKTIYTFSYLLLDNEKTIGNSIIRFNK
jgi:hypothetical protein